MKKFRISIFADGRQRYITFRNSIEEANSFAAETIPARMATGRVVITLRDCVNHDKKVSALGRKMANAANPYIASIYQSAISACLNDVKSETFVESYDISD